MLPTGEEIDYLCGVVNEYFRTAIGAADVVWAFAGVRSLYDDGARKPQDIGRDYALMLDERFGEAPLLTVYGGKITTYRRLAEDVLARLSHFFPRSRPWTAQSPLPGGDFVYDGIETLIERTQRTWPFLTADHARRLMRAYGTRVDRVLDDGDRPRRSRHALWRRSHRRRGALPDEQGMGADRRRRAVAPFEARPAFSPRRSKRSSASSPSRSRLRLHDWQVRSAEPPAVFPRTMEMH